MYFKRLEIFGFKSFADKTVLNFEPGITAVVGPNGCGKSNIFDSIRWVLGEQSMKELRGSSTEDVIFNGTDKKPALGFAEVSLTFCNEPKMLAIEYDEVTITRRIFRSGESEYLINKNVVRLKDVLELFMGTGVGAEAYSLVQQGKVDLIVSARPEDRRIIIDEAAGITKYKAKKKEALNKLKDTEDNLLRINDIILEVKRQIGSLERQASKARRYKEAYERLKKLEIKLAESQIDASGLEQNEINNLFLNLKEQLNAFIEEHSQLNENLTKENNALNDLEQKVNDVHAQEAKIQNEIAMDERQIHFNEERTKELLRQTERLIQQKAQLMQQSQIQEEKINALKEALKALSTATQENLAILIQKKESLSFIAQENKHAKETIRKNEELILDLTSKQVNIKNDLTEVMKEFQGYLARKRRLETEYDKVILEKEEADNRLKNVSEEIDVYNQKNNELKATRDLRIGEVGELKSRFLKVEEAVNDLEKRRLFLKSQKEFIEELRVQYQDIPDPVIEGILWSTVPPSENHMGMIGKVKAVNLVDQNKINEIKSRFPQWNQAHFHEIICETKFIELDPQKIIARIDDLTNQIESLSQQKQTLAQEMKEKEDMVASLSSSMHDVEKVLSSYEAKKIDILNEVGKLASELDLVNEELKEAKEAIHSLKAKEDELTSQLASMEQNIQICQSDIKEKQELMAQKGDEREEATVLIAQLETEIQAAREQERAQQENLQLFEETKTSNSEEIKRLDQEGINNEQKKKELEDQTIELRAKIESSKEKRESLKGVYHDYEMQKTESLTRIEEIRRSILVVEERNEKIKSEAHQQELKSQEIAFHLRSIKDRLLQTYKINFDEVILSLNAQAQDPLPTQLQEQVQGDAQQSEAQVQNFPQVQPQAEALAPALFEPELNGEALILEIETLKKRCDSYGTVNLIAIEEFDALKERFEFLTKQQIDLINAKESLNQTITKINRTTRQMFLDTFTKVSEEFRIYFRMLFGGGEAQLILVDPDNVLESGIEIIARPPGKKLQNIMLLSGGEKSLAAIALIFGVFKVKPSPFCVLDEIDAALDEANVGRFGYLLKDFAKIAQFIVITHNKKTIINANVMYGITMQESGVSRIVSVKFAEEEMQKEKEEVPAGV